MKKLLLFTFTFSLFTLCKAQLTDVYSFSHYEHPDGSSLLIEGNVMYGATQTGGLNGDGNVFSVNIDGSNYKNLWSFADTGSHSFNASGYEPYCNLLLLGDRLYGFTQYGGSHNDGQIFSIKTNGTGFKDIWDFSDTGVMGNADGSTPYYGGLQYISGKLYGVTAYGGYYNYGTVFSIDTTGKNYKDLFDFNNGANTGYLPYSSSLALSGKKLFGTCLVGGANGDGTIFTIDTNGHNFKDMYDFTNGIDGERPEGGLTLSGSKLYGMTSQGASFGYGSIFSLDTTGKNFKAMVDFNSANGKDPYSNRLTLNGHTLYGATSYGGVGNMGILFSVDTNGSSLKDLFEFNLSDGEYSNSDLTLVGGDTLYGMTYDGGSFNSGTIFRFVDTNIDLGINTAKTIRGSVAVYPNPSNGSFTIALSGTTSKSIVEVYNTMGQAVYTGALASGNNTITMDNKANGVYLYRIISDNGNLVGQGKLVIQK